MLISYDGLNSPENILTFTDIPNILKISETVNGTKASFTFSFSGSLQTTVTADSQYYVTFLGETVSNVMDVNNAQNKRFYIASDNPSTAASFARALRNCGGISAEFNIIHSGSTVTLVAKTIGQKWSGQANYIQRNIPAAYLSANGTDGTTSSNLYGSKIGVDIYNSDGADSSNFVTSLEKNWYGNECAFDVSPVLATFSEYGKTNPYYFVLSLTKANGEWQSLGNVSGYTTIGYHANQSESYLNIDGMHLLMNNTRGENGTILYVYGKTIPVSVLCDSNTVNAVINYSLKDSGENELYSGTTTIRKPLATYIVDGEVSVPDAYYDDAFYVDLSVGENTYRFNVIKPLKAAEGYQRVCWRNEYGGISFFDFTGAHTEADNVTNETYEKSVFDYYDSDAYEKKKIYSNDYIKTVTLNSHLMEKDGKWIFNSLMRSKSVWTYVNGKTYYIIPKTIEVVEDQNYNDIFTAKFSYTYSNID